MKLHVGPVLPFLLLSCQRGKMRNFQWASGHGKSSLADTEVHLLRYDRKGLEPMVSTLSGHLTTPPTPLHSQI